MTDMERDTIDSETEAIIKATAHLLSNLKRNLLVDYRGRSSQVFSHRKAILEIISAYLKAVCKIYSEQRAIRVKKASDMKRMSRLESLVRASKLHRKKEEWREEESQSNSRIPTEEDPGEVTGIRHRKNLQNQPDKKVEEKARGFLFDLESESGRGGTEDLTNEEAAQFTKENEQLYHKMNSMVDEMQELEGKVVEISKLQAVFAEKVLEQEGDIYRINEVAIHTTENIKSGNEQIREAMRKRASMRVYIMFFLIVMSFTLLFLHWYNS